MYCVFVKASLLLVDVQFCVNVANSVDCVRQKEVVQSVI